MRVQSDRPSSKDLQRVTRSQTVGAAASTSSTRGILPINEMIRRLANSNGPICVRVFSPGFKGVTSSFDDQVRYSVDRRKDARAKRLQRI